MADEEGKGRRGDPEEEAPDLDDGAERETDEGEEDELDGDEEDELDGDEEDELDGDEEDEYDEGDELDELYDERDRLRERVAELEAKLAERSRAPSGRWAQWVLGTIAAAAALTLVVVFLGNGFPVPRGSSQSTEEGSSAEEGEIYALITEHAEELQTCFDAWAAQSKARPGTIILTLIEVDVGEGGIPSLVEVTGEDVPQPFAACLRRAVNAWVFPVEGRQFAFEVPFEVRGGLPILRDNTEAGTEANNDANNDANPNADGGG